MQNWGSIILNYADAGPRFKSKSFIWHFLLLNKHPKDFKFATRLKNSSIWCSSYKGFNSLRISATPSRQGCDIHLFSQQHEACAESLWSVWLQGFGKPLSYFWTQRWLVPRFQMAWINNLRWCGLETCAWTRKSKKKLIFIKLLLLWGLQFFGDLMHQLSFKSFW